MRRIHEVHCQARSTGIAEVCGEARDTADKLRLAFASRSDEHKKGTTRIDWTGNEEVVYVSGSQTNLTVKMKEEDDGAKAFASALNQREGRSYTVEEKLKEDGDFLDRWLKDDTLPKEHPDYRIGIQITHLDSIIIASLNRDRKYDNKINAQYLAEAAIEAIRRKQGVDRNTARKTYLVLITPYPIRQSLHQGICQTVRDANPDNIYRETWVVPFHEPPFRVQWPEEENHRACMAPSLLVFRG